MTKLCVTNLYVTNLCVTKLCVTNLCVTNLCVTKLYVANLCVCDKVVGDKEDAEEEEELATRGGANLKTRTPRMQQKKQIFARVRVGQQWLHFAARRRLRSGAADVVGRPLRFRVQGNASRITLGFGQFGN